MTVIACKDGWLAADTASWTGGIWVDGAEKIRRLRDGSLAGCAGWKPEIEAALEWYLAEADPKERPAAPSDKDAQPDILILKPDCSIWYIADHCRLWRSDFGIGTAGSHHEFLYGAMLAGLGAKEAVALAIEHCQYARGKVIARHIDDR